MGKVLYSSPLKALSSEKMRDWSKLFPDKKILQLTGDTLTNQKIRKQMMEECNTADLILMTVELLDSLTRNHFSENYQWVRDVDLLIADESHGIAMEERGHVIEASIIRFCQIAPQAKIWFMSATLPNTEEFAKWLETLNGKHSEIINSSWRPTELRWNFIPHNIFGSYYENQEDKIRLAVEIIEEHQNESTLCFVHDKNTGRRIESILKSMDINCEFYNADLDFETRQDLLEKFESPDNSLPVLISTSALAWGNLEESTLILMADCSEKLLKDIEVNDWITTIDPTTRDVVVEHVLHKEECTPVMELELILEDGRTVKCGPRHAFYLTSGQLKRANELKVGDDLAVI